MHQTCPSPGKITQNVHRWFYRWASFKTIYIQKSTSLYVHQNRYMSFIKLPCQLVTSFGKIWIHSTQIQSRLLVKGKKLKSLKIIYWHYLTSGHFLLLWWWIKRFNLSLNLYIQRDNLKHPFLEQTWKTAIFMDKNFYMLHHNWIFI